MLVLIPLPLFFASTVFGAGGLTAWVVIGIFWCFCSAFTVVLYPLWESRAALAQISRGILKVRQSFRELTRDADSLYLRTGYICKGKRKAHRDRSLVRSVGVHTKCVVGCIVNITCTVLGLNVCRNDR